MNLKNNILFLDISLKKTGYCILYHKRGMKRPILHISTIENNLVTDRGISFREMFTGLSILNIIDTYNISELVIEDYAFSKFANSRAASTLSELRGIITSLCYNTNPIINITMVAPNQSVKSLLPSGKFQDRKQKKKETIDAANIVLFNNLLEQETKLGIDINIARIPETEDDMADAFALFYHWYKKQV
jgi:Holliday junction resolvasome RuvABC endonuclease subunit